MSKVSKSAQTRSAYSRLGLLLGLLPLTFLSTGCASTYSTADSFVIARAAPAPSGYQAAVLAQRITTRRTTGS